MASYNGKGKRSGSKKNKSGNIVPTVSNSVPGAAKRKQAVRRPVKQEAPIFPAETTVA